MSKHLMMVGLAALWLVPRPARAADGPDVARLGPLLETAAEASRDQRIADGAGAVGTGVIFAGAGVASWVTASDPGARETRDVLGGVFVGVGGLMLAAGALSLATKSALEERRDAYWAVRRDHPEAAEAVLREAEGEVFAKEEAAKTERLATAVVSFVFGAAEIVGGIALEASTEDPGLRWLGRGLLAGGVGAGIFGVAALSIRSEPERMADRWRHERTVPDPTGSSAMTLFPRLGVGGVGFAGTF